MGKVDQLHVFVWVCLVISFNLISVIVFIPADILDFSTWVLKMNTQAVLTQSVFHVFSLYEEAPHKYLFGMRVYVANKAAEWSTLRA